jgi:type IV secretory pathway TraG/TraD family ATPase VirD4
MDQPEGGTIVDIMRLFTDDAFAEAKIRNLKNPVVAARWNKTYKKMGDREKAEIIPFIQAKFGPFTTGTYVRNIIGQQKSAFKMYDAMQQKKIILVNLSKGISGEETSKLIGKILVMQIKLSALKRAKIAENDRVPFYLYVDEFQNYVSTSFESILSEARKYRLGLTVAHQYVDQLKSE